MGDTQKIFELLKIFCRKILISRKRALHLFVEEIAIILFHLAGILLLNYAFVAEIPAIPDCTLHTPSEMRCRPRRGFSLHDEHWIHKNITRYQENHTQTTCPPTHMRPYHTTSKSSTPLPLTTEDPTHESNASENGNLSRKFAIFDKENFPNNKWIIGYAPKYTVVNRIMEEVKKLLLKYGIPLGAKELQVIGFESEYTMMKRVSKGVRIRHAVMFDNLTSATQLPKVLDLIVRLEPILNFDHVMNFPITFEEGEIPRIRISVYDSYLTATIMEAFVNLRTKQENNISLRYEWLSGGEERMNDLYLKESPEFYHHILEMTTFLLMLLHCSLSLSEERESLVWPFMSQIGIPLKWYFLCRIAGMYLITVFIDVSTLLVKCVPLFGYPPFFPLTDVSAAMFLSVLYAIPTTAFVFMTTMIFSGGSRGAVNSVITMFLMLLLQTLAIHSRELKMLVLFFTSDATVRTQKKIFLLEREAVGMQWVNIHVAMVDKLSIIEDIILTLSGSVVMAFLTWLFFYIRVLSTPWKALPSVLRDKQGSLSKANDESFKIIPGEETPFVQISDLWYTGSNKLIDVNLKIYRDTINVIVGMESSGSSRLSAILKGASFPSAGSVNIKGLDREKDWLKVSHFTGVCPSDTNSLFPKLTVRDNLEFFSKLKLIFQRKRGDALKEIVEDCGLTNILDCIVGSLSPSEKRMFQLAVAYVGVTEMIILEDPTEGMNPLTRCRAWDFIRKHRFGRTTVVSTINMQEAEFNGDVVIVFEGGKIMQQGKPSELKFAFDTGYHLMIRISNKAHEDIVHAMVLHHIPDAMQQDSPDDHSILYLLRQQTAKKFARLFANLGAFKDNLYIMDFEVEPINMEEAFVQKIMNSLRIRGQSGGFQQKSTFSSTDEEEIADIDLAERVQRASGSPESRNQANDEIRSEDNILSRTSSFTVNPTSNKIQGLEPKHTGLRHFIQQAHALSRKKTILWLRAYPFEIIQAFVIWIWCYVSLMDVDFLNDVGDMHLDHIKQPKCPTFIPVTANYNRNKEGEALFRELKKFLRTKYIPCIQVLPFNGEETTAEDFSTKMAAMYMEPFFGIDLTNSTNSHLEATLWYRYMGGWLHSNLLVATTAMMNTYLKVLTADDDQEIKLRIQPRALNEFRRFPSVSGDHEVASVHFLIPTFARVMAVAFCLIPYSALEERKSGLQEVQFKGGGSPLCHWLINLVVDMLSYAFLSNIVVMVCVQSMSDQWNPIGNTDIFVMFLVNGIMMLCHLYVFQKWFRYSTLATLLFVIVNDVSAKALWTYDLDNVLHGYVPWFLLVFPHVYFPRMFATLITSWVFLDNCRMIGPECEKKFFQRLTTHCEKCCKDLENSTTCEQKSYHEVVLMEGRIIELTSLMLYHTAAWFLLLMIIDYKIFPRMRAFKLDHYIDSLKSKFKREKSRSQTPHLQIRSIYKTSLSRWSNIETDLPNQKDQTLSDLDNVHVKLEKGDFLCLVTTDWNVYSTITRRMHRGDIFDADGKAFFEQQKIVGVCPSIYMYKSLMTIREYITLNARLRGTVDVDKEVRRCINEFQLEHVQDTHPTLCSYGIRRLLSIAIAVVAEPDLIILDDPLSRLGSKEKFLATKILKKKNQKGATIIMTSMDVGECNEVATRLAIFVERQLILHQTPEEIRLKFCNSYMLIASFSQVEQSQEEFLTSSLMAYLKRKFPQCVLYHEAYDLLQVLLPRNINTLCGVFETCENKDTKKKFHIANYTLRHTNFNDVMRDFEKQAELQGDKTGKTNKRKK